MKTGSPRVSGVLASLQVAAPDVALNTRLVKIIIPIDKDWQFRGTDDNESPFRDTVDFPTEIYRDLLHHGLIPDPFLGKNEDCVQWVGEMSWTYRATFEIELYLTEKHWFLVCEGLDTFATLKLNGKVIIKAANAFTPYRINVRDVITHGRNEIEIIFESAWLKGKKLIKHDPNHRWGCWNGDPSRLAVRKPQYHYGWDWGPTLLTCGPWKPIYVENFAGKISDLSFVITIDDDLSSAQVKVCAEVEGEGDIVSLELQHRGECIAKAAQVVEKGSNIAHHTFRTTKPNLWYPHRYGAQPIYTVSAHLLRANIPLDRVYKKFGLRKAKLIQQELEDAPGRSFLFEINNIPIFCGGSSWIPAHNLLTTMTKETYQEWIKMAVESNQVMLRVWGGGIYEQDAFYEACDEMGVLVWQDFMFACGNYPANEDFMNSIKEEATANVKRLRHHPCIVLWAGNNEDYSYQESEGLEYDPFDKNPEHWLKSSFPARYIYEKLLPEIMQDLAPDVYYHFGSPYGGKTVADPTVGDIHQWNMWHGTQEEYQNLDKLCGRFVSEFGMEAYPDTRTLDGILVGPSRDLERHPQSSTIEFHNKAAGGVRRIALYLAENVKYDMKPFEQYVYCTQVMQSEAISTGYRLWKRQWKGPNGKYCAGALVWQMNDCWPGISWSIVDHYLRPKLAYYAVKREMQPFSIGMKRTVRQIPRDKYTRADAKTIHEIEAWICNLTLEAVTIQVEFQASVLVTKQRASDRVSSETEIAWSSVYSLTVPPNASTELGQFEIREGLDKGVFANQTVIYAHVLQFHDNDDAINVLCTGFNWPEPLKHVHLPQPEELSLFLTRLSPEAISTDCSGQDWRRRTPPKWYRPPNRVCVLQIKSDVPLKCVQLECSSSDEKEEEAERKDVSGQQQQQQQQRNNHDVWFDDNGFDLFANEPHDVCVWGLDVGEEDRVKVRYLNMV